ncbi:hypothetical protein PSCICO_14330 [Pseudomonas cichorii]|nr:hypothetical protein PSCICO_14330 [Pseudomonas cichorii]
MLAYMAQAAIALWNAQDDWVTALAAEFHGFVRSVKADAILACCRADLQVSRLYDRPARGWAVRRFGA